RPAMLSASATTNTVTGSGRVNPFEAARASAHTVSSNPDPISTSHAIDHDLHTAAGTARPAGRPPARLGAPSAAAGSAVTTGGWASTWRSTPHRSVCTVDTVTAGHDHAPVVGQPDGQAPGVEVLQQRHGDPAGGVQRPTGLAECERLRQ